MTSVLFLTESFHPVLGGGEQHIRALSRRLVETGMKTGVLTRRADPAWAAEETLDGVRVLRVGPGGPGRSGKYRMVPAVLAALRRERSSYDVLVVRGTRVLGPPGLLGARLLGKAVVLQAEVNGEVSGEAYTWGTPLDRRPLRALVGAGAAMRNRLLQDADAFVAMSRLIREEFLAAGLPREKVFHIPHGVDTERFRPALPAERLELRARLRLPAEACIVIYTGRLLRGKGLEVLLDAFAGLGDGRCHLLLVGSGAGQSLSVEPQLAEWVRRAGCTGRVTLTGPVDNVEDYLRASDVFVLPSLFEALGLSLIEAAACGLPCVGSRTGGIVDVIEDGASGILVAPGDARGLAEALRALLLADASVLAAMGTRGREVVRARFDLRDSVLRYRSLFREVTRRWDGRRPGRAPRAGAAAPR